jgi:hypothetical protein
MAARVSPGCTMCVTVSPLDGRGDGTGVAPGEVVAVGSTTAVSPAGGCVGNSPAPGVPSAGVTAETTVSPGLVVASSPLDGALVCGATPGSVAWDSRSSAALEQPTMPTATSAITNKRVLVVDSLLFMYVTSRSNHHRNQITGSS